MNLDFGLHMHQEQKLIMTQELQLSVKILQLTSYELQEYIEEQLLENPLLEYGEKSNTGDNKAEDKYETAHNEESIKDDTDNNSFDLIDRMITDANADSNFDEDRYYNGEDDDVSPLNFVSKEINLWEFLKEQLNLTPTSKKTTKICEYIIDNIDENGYLTVDIENISNQTKCTTDDAEKMIELVQSFEPVGICSRNIQECLLLQLRSKGINDKILENIINNMLVEVGYNKISKIAKENGITEKLAEEYVTMIKKLDPKPGIRYCCETTRYIIPDVFIEKVDGNYIVTVNEEGIPELKINKTYRKLLSNKDAPEYKYVKERLQAALWIIKSIEQRINTIKRVVEAIIHYQIDFFEKDTDLKPLTLKQIANDIEMHESTVSRAVNGKYAQSPKGVFELKNFFMRGVQNKTGEDISTLKIKNRIRDIIAKEDDERPLSDQQISEMLDSQGMNISRRTVAKYREEIGIPSSSKRKK
jgi:RNA polymerase sigma-54 factor